MDRIIESASQWFQARHGLGSAEFELQNREQIMLPILSLVCFFEYSSGTQAGIECCSEGYSGTLNHAEGTKALTIVVNSIYLRVSFSSRYEKIRRFILGSLSV